METKAMELDDLKSAWQALDARLGLRAVTHGVAEAPDGIDGAGSLSLAKNGIEGVEVCVYVRDKQGSHITNVAGWP